MIIMTYAESMGLILYCNDCEIAVALHEHDHWTSEEHGPHLTDTAQCWKCKQIIKVPTRAEVDLFETTKGESHD